MKPYTFAPLLAAAALCPAAFAQEQADATHITPITPITPIGLNTELTLNLSQAIAQPAAQPETPSADPTAPAASTTITTTPAPKPADPAARSTSYGKAGSRWWTVGLGGANDFEDASDIYLYADWSQFLADDFEFAIEAALWYFDQPGANTGAVSGSMIFRWHFAHADDYNWSIFGDAGIGLLAAFDNVPEGGTGFDFLPRLGAGFTLDLDSTDGPDHGARLLAGLYWQHISNGRIAGDSSNPSRNSLAAYIAIVFPF